MATINVFSSTDDGYINNSGIPVWSTLRNATTGNSANSTSSVATAISAFFAGGNYGIRRSFFDFDLSSLSGTITSASVFIHGDGLAQASQVSAQQGTQAIPITTADYNNFTGAEWGFNSTWSASAYNEIVISAGGITYLNGVLGSGLAKVCARERVHDFLNSAPAGIFQNGVTFADNATNKPYIELVGVSEAVGGDDALFFSHNF